MSEGAARGPGAALREAREARGVSAEEVAGAMNLPVGIVRSIEADAFDALPSATFTRGYIRTYARLLRLDGDVLTRAYSEATRDAGESELVVEVAKPSLAELPQRHPGSVFGGAVLALALAGAAVLWWAWPEETEPAEVASAGDGAAGETRRTAPGESPGRDRVRPPGANATPAGPVPPRADAADPSNADPVGDGPVPSRVETPDASDAAPVGDGLVPSRAGTPDASDAAPVGDGPVPSRTDTTNASDAAPVGDGPVPSRADTRADIPDPSVPAAVLAAAPSTVAPSSSRTTGNGADVLELAFAEDCWVEVFDREGRVVHMDMSLAGQSLRLRGEAPFSIRLGNAPASVLAFNGAPVELEPHTRANVANLVLGD